MIFLNIKRHRRFINCLPLNCDKVFFSTKISKVWGEGDQLTHFLIHHKSKSIGYKSKTIGSCYIGIYHQWFIIICSWIRCYSSTVLRYLDFYERTNIYININMSNVCIHELPLKAYICCIWACILIERVKNMIA